jgi:pyroglutamyl-peptidase
MTQHPIMLVTAFEPYDGSPINPAEQVLKQLPDIINGVNLRKLALACDSVQTPLRVTELASDPLVNMVVIIGEDRRYAVPTLERIAYNWLQYDVPDNQGLQPVGTSIVSHGPVSLETPVDVATILIALTRTGTLINISDDPGRHLCNHVYYIVRYHTDPKPVLLLHLPRLPEQQNHPSMELADSLQVTFDVLKLLSFLIEEH